MRNVTLHRRLSPWLVLCGALAALPSWAQAPSRLDAVLDRIVANERELATTLEQYRSLVEAYLQTVKPEAFARMLTLDRGAFDRGNYDFTFLRAEFLGEVRTLVFDVVPRDGKGLDRVRTGRFTGRIWVEDRDYRIVRFNGVYASSLVVNFHFDSWRLEMAPGLWLPAYACTEESEPAFKQVHLTHKGQTRIWGYDILRTVVSNLEITNGLNIRPPVRCRVLLTTPLESFTVGHTIVLSRGLIDVLPDEASLAMVLAHELGHVIGGHELDTRFAFTDQVLIGDKQAMEQFAFERDPVEEREADDRAVELLGNSPYQDDLATAGLFLRALAANARELRALIRPHFGSQMTEKEQLVRMTRIVEKAPELDPAEVDQVAALPLGGRVKLDPWTARIELMNHRRVALLSAREKMPFQVTPLVPYLARFGARGEAVAEGDAAPPAARPTTVPESETVAADRGARESR